MTYNIREIRHLYNLTQEEFALALGITRELVNKMEKGKSGVSKATNLLIQRFIHERQSEYSSHEIDFVGIPASSEKRKVLSPSYQTQRREQKNETTSLLVPLVGIKAQAGYIKGYEHVDYIDSLQKYSLPPGVNPTGAVWSYFEVDGDSMEPTFYAGDILLASMLAHEDWTEIKNFGVYVILTTTQLLVKRVYRKNENEWILLSDNEEVYPQFTLPVADIKQVWTFRRHIRSRVPQPKEFRITA